MYKNIAWQAWHSNQEEKISAQFVIKTSNITFYLLLWYSLIATSENDAEASYTSSLF